MRRPRFAALAIGIVVMLVTLSVRLYDLQIVNGAYYRALAEENRLLRLPVPADRGMIVDRNGVVLAKNSPGFSVSVLPVDLPRDREIPTAERLGALVGRDGADVLAAIRLQRLRNPYEPAKISLKPVPREIALLLVERYEEYPGVRVDASAIRSYTDGPLYSPILGYVGAITPEELEDREALGYLPDDDIGRTGVESVYERYLRGTYGWREVERDAAQRELRTLAEIPSEPGGNVVLSLDDRLQRLIANELEEGIQKDAFSQAVAIAMNPQNGEILAMVSTPAYDNNWFANGITTQQIASLNADTRHPLVNKAIGEIYPPGSTFKMVTGVAALNEGTATRGTIVNVTSSSFSISGTPFFDWTTHGSLDFVNGFAHSSDIYFYSLAGGTPFSNVRGVGPDAMARYGRMFGFGAPTGIDIPGEADGIMPSPEWKLAELGEPWSIGNTYHASIGQGFVAVTPLQLLNAYAAVANGGTLYTPRVLKEVRGIDGTSIFTQDPKVTRTLDVTSENLRLIRESARRVVTIGHAVMPNVRLPIAGKTGTAEFGASSGKDSAGRDLLGFHNWFVSFVPQADNADPTAQIAMVVFTFDSSKTLCELCLNPAVAITQRVYEAYLTPMAPAR